MIDPVTLQAKYELRNGALHVTISGIYDQAGAQKNRDNIARIVAETGIRHAIIDLREAIISQSTLDIYELNSSLDSLIPKDARFAFVYSPRTLPRELAAFAENVLVNSGYEARVCEDPEEALRWVMERE